jgi:hypothetical protein
MDATSMRLACWIESELELAPPKTLQDLNILQVHPFRTILGFYSYQRPPLYHNLEFRPEPCSFDFQVPVGVRMVECFL